MDASVYVFVLWLEKSYRGIWWGHEQGTQGETMNRSCDREKMASLQENVRKRVGKKLEEAK